MKGREEMIRGCGWWEDIRDVRRMKWKGGIERTEKGGRVNINQQKNGEDEVINNLGGRGW
jgi:hypothetical protein